MHDRLLEEPLPFVRKTVMATVNGKPWRCDCGANVLTQISRVRFKCNGCGARYEGE